MGRRAAAHASHANASSSFVCSLPAATRWKKRRRRWRSCREERGGVRGRMLWRRRIRAQIMKNGGNFWLPNSESCINAAADAWDSCKGVHKGQWRNPPRVVHSRRHSIALAHAALPPTRPSAESTPVSQVVRSTEGYGSSSKILPLV